MRPDLLVRDARRAAGLTQAQLAARLGVSQSAIAKLEPGPSIDVDLVRRHLMLTPSERIHGLEQMHAETRKIAGAGARARASVR